MKLSELMEQLTELRCGQPDDYDPEIRLAHQPHYPFEYTLADAAAHDPSEGEDDWGNDPELTTDSERGQARHDHAQWKLNNPAVIYLIEGAQIGYLSGAAATAIGWGGR